MIELRQTWTAARQWRILSILALVSLLFQGCGAEAPIWSLDGPLFEAQEKAPPDAALVYVYWSPEEKSGAEQIWVMPVSYPIRRGGYVMTTFRPGKDFLLAMQDFPLAFFDAQSPQLEIDARAGETYFFRIEPKRRLLLPHFEVQPVEAATALSEIRKCRLMIDPHALEQDEDGTDAVPAPAS